MYIVARKDDGTNSELRNASVEYGFRVLSKVTGYPLYSSTFTWLMKVPERMGNMDLARRFYITEPRYIRSENDIPSEVEGANVYKALGGSKDTIGYGFITDTLEEHDVGYDLLTVKSI